MTTTSASRPSGRVGQLVRTMRRVLDDNDASLAGRNVLALCSGGIDSVALVALLSRLPRGAAPATLRVLWLDHALRPDVAAERAAAGRAAERAAAAFMERRATRPLALEPGGVEAAARAWRYETAVAVARECECDVVVTGHTASDQLESALLSLAGVTGSGAVDAMPVRRRLALDVDLVRPLLAVGRAEVETFVRDAGLDACDDPSNALVDAHVRNAIRHLVVPPLLAAHPGAGSAIVRAAERARSSREATAALAAALLESWRVETGPSASGTARLDVRRLAQLPRSARRDVIAEWLRGAGVGRGLSTRIIRAVDGLATAPGCAADARVDLPRSASVRRDGYHLVFDRTRQQGAARP